MDGNISLIMLVIVRRRKHPKHHHHCCFYEEEASATAAEFMFDHPPGDSRSPSGCSLWAAAD